MNWRCSWKIFCDINKLHCLQADVFAAAAWSCNFMLILLVIKSNMYLIKKMPCQSQIDIVSIYKSLQEPEHWVLCQTCRSSAKYLTPWIPVLRDLIWIWYNCNYSQLGVPSHLVSGQSLWCQLCLLYGHNSRSWWGKYGNSAKETWII